MKHDVKFYNCLVGSRFRKRYSRECVSEEIDYVNISELNFIN